MATIYQKAKAILPGNHISNHESDLYLKVTSESQKLIDEYEHKEGVRQFTNQKDAKPWFDIPFAYDPYWEEKEKKINKK